MPTPADQRWTLFAAALLTAALTLVAWNALGSARALGQKPLPPEDLQSFVPFLAPLPDTSVLAHALAGTIAVPRDPFGATPAARSSTPTKSSAGTTTPAPEQEQRWVVSTILFEGTKKSAFVNNAWVTVGDPLGGGSRLTAVERDHVVVTDAKGVRHVVPIQGGES
jgi:hypothetical protein